MLDAWRAVAALDADLLLGPGAEQGVLDVVGHAGLDADLERVLGDPPREVTGLAPPAYSPAGELSTRDGPASASLSQPLPSPAASRGTAIPGEAWE